MIRVRSDDVWFNAPGIQVAYQAIGAPDSLAARQNVGNDARMAGRHTAKSVAMPTQNPAKGWVFSGSSFLQTGIVYQAGWFSAIRFDNTTSLAGRLWGACNAGYANIVGLIPDAYGSLLNVEIDLGNQQFFVPGYTSGVLALNRNDFYVSGRYARTVVQGSHADIPIMIAALNNNGTPGFFFTGNIQAFVVGCAKLSPAHLAQYSRQMAYCHLNPDWNAWGRRRRYYYAPSAAAGRVGIYGARGAVALPGGVSIRGGNHG